MGEEALFIEALEREDPAERAAFLDRACANDPALRRRIERLLQRHQQADSFLDSPAAAPVAMVEGPLSERPGAVIGPYKLLEQIGEGGFGVVFMAEQQQPIHRKVALKVLKPGMDTRQVVARFEAERQALALMDHPHIAKVFDGGTTDSGRPYFVMELLKGTPITKYCDEHRLTPRQRLELFVPVCQAVQHAHQKGVIHRDVKPSNVLVAPYDGKPVVKVIDFGVVKATGQKLTDQTLFTGFGAVVGTLDYMSPEQAELNNQDIDTRSDIYSLGVLLYELLTGTTPLDRARHGQATLMDLLRHIREEEPPLPSTRLCNADTVPAVAAARQTEPAKLAKLVRGELDWIVMKALEKDRSRRYETADALARDLERHLHDEAVEACPPRTSYRLWKLFRRHRTALLLAATFAILLLCGIFSTTGGLIWALREQQAKEQARQDAIARAGAEQQAKELAQQRLSQLVKANEVLAAIFQKLDPKAEEKGGPPLRVQLGERLEQAARLVEGEMVGDVLVVARLQHLLGTSLRGLGHYAQAQPLLEKARQSLQEHLGADHTETLGCKHRLATVFHAQGMYNRAQTLYDEVLQTQTAKLGADHADILPLKHNLAMLYREQGDYDRAQTLSQEVVEVSTAKWGPDHPETLASKNNLAVLYQYQGKYDRAETLWQEVLQTSIAKLGADHPDTLACKHHLATLYRVQGDYERARALSQEVLQALTARLGADHPNTLKSKGALAALYQVEGKYDQAEALYQEALPVLTAKLGADHPSTLLTKSDLAVLYQSQGKYDRAETLSQEVLQARTAKLGADHTDTLASKHNLAALYQAQEKYDRAETLCQEVLHALIAKLGPDHPETLKSKYNLATLSYAQGNYDRAETLYQEVLAQRRRTIGPDHPDTLTAMANLGVFYRIAGRPTEAEPLLEEAVRRARKRPDVWPAGLTQALESAATSYDEAGQFAQAESLYLDLVERARRQHRPDDQGTATRLASLGRTLLRQDKHAAAEPILREALEVLERQQPDDWTTFGTKSLLGASLLGQQKYEEAEPLLVQGYDGMKQRAAKIPTAYRALHLTAALERLTHLYDAWGRPGDKAKWLKEREATKQ